MSRAGTRLVLVWLVLLVLLGATVGAAFLPLGALKSVLGYGIAALKSALVLWFFMDMRREGALARMATIAAFVWLLIMLTLTTSDYLGRGLSASG